MSCCGYSISRKRAYQSYDELMQTLSLKGENIKITFVVTEEWFGFIESKPRPPQIQLRTIPNLIPSELVRALDFAGFVDSVFTKMEAPIEQLMDELELESPVTVIIADTYVPFTVSVGSRRNIPVVSLWTMSQRGHEVIDYIPGVAPTRLSDMPGYFEGTGRKVLGRVLEAFDMVRKAQCVLLTSFHEIEVQVVETLMSRLPFPIYSVGPSIPHLPANLDQYNGQTPNGNSDKKDYYLKWLDEQPRNSVLYVSLGSFLSVSKDQMEEILAGLHDSKVRYLLISRGDTSFLEGSLADDEMGGCKSFVVSWCDQLRVLCHSSIGGFWTHCGWNSTLEGVYSVGMKVTGAEKLIKRDEISNIIKKFMDLDGDHDESKKMRRRSDKLKERCEKALAKGGSSDINLNAFIKNILKVA
ncbi:hypothetical protein C5167_022844 [Papaver somniferum]|uniref:UDP-glycosyltransferases domain-containing protein n=1 Tax=Papaver somniferum TaxID=3469 RepID=A0A4Y7JMR3_PAPSO|nr:hypothetical protein C5167_022844 [Papaver somniferum]